MQPNSLFSTQQPSFGQSAQQGQISLFGPSTPSQGIFGQGNQPSFGNQPSLTSTSPFGGTGQTNAFPSNPPNFGQNQNPLQQTNPSLFGNPNQTPQSIFSGNQGKPIAPFGNTGQSNPGIFGGNAQPSPFGSFGNSSTNVSGPFGQPIGSNAPSFPGNQQRPTFTPTLTPAQGPSFPQTPLFQSTPLGTSNPFTPSQPQMNQTPFSGLGTQNNLNSAQIFQTSSMMPDNKPLGQQGFNSSPFQHKAPFGPSGLGSFAPGSQLTFANQKGTVGKQFQVLQNAKNNKVNTITFMPEYSKKSLTLLRLEDYQIYKNNLDSVTNQTAKNNLVNYFQRLGQGAMGGFHGPMQTNFLNPGLNSPKVNKPSTLSFMNPQPISNSLFPPTNPSPFQNPVSMFDKPMIGQTSQPSPLGLNPNPIQGTGGAFPSLTPSNQQSSLFPSQSGPFQLNQTLSTGVGPFQQTQSVFPSLATAPLFPSQPAQAQSQSKPFSGLGGLDNKGGINLFPANISAPSNPLFPSQNTGLPQLNLQNPKFDFNPNTPSFSLAQPANSFNFPLNSNPLAQNPAPTIEPLFDPSKAQQPLPSPNLLSAPQTIFQTQNGQPFSRPELAQQLSGLFGDVQKGPFAIYCFPLNHKSALPKTLAQPSELGLSGQQMISNLDEELRALRLGAPRDLESPDLLRIDSAYYEPTELDPYYPCNRGYEEYERFKDAKNIVRKKLNLSLLDEKIKRMQQAKTTEKALLNLEKRPSKFYEGEKISEGLLAFCLTLELELQEKTTVLNTKKFRPSSMVAEVLRYLIEEKALLKNEDLDKISVRCNGRTLNLISKLEEAHVKENDVIFILVSDERAKFDQQTEETKWLPKLTKKDYQCKPSIKEMNRLGQEAISRLSAFEIWNSHARIVFSGPIDVHGLDLDRIVILNEKSVEIYPASEFEDQLPPVGFELNRPCVITFMHLIKGPIKDFGSFVNKIDRMAKAMNAEVKSIDSNTGAVSIAVQSFK